VNALGCCPIMERARPTNGKVGTDLRAVRSLGKTEGRSELRPYNPRTFRREVPTYSERKATIGFTFVARRAGSQQATSAIPASNAVTAPNTSGSMALVW
jgi:hypothetical protein